MRNAAAITLLHHSPDDLIETAKLNRIDPHVWRADTIARSPDYKTTTVDHLPQWQWNG